MSATGADPAQQVTTAADVWARRLPASYRQQPPVPHGRSQLRLAGLDGGRRPRELDPGHPDAQLRLADAGLRRAAARTDCRSARHRARAASPTPTTRRPVLLQVGTGIVGRASSATACAPTASFLPTSRTASCSPMRPSPVRCCSLKAGSRVERHLALPSTITTRSASSTRVGHLPQERAPTPLAYAVDNGKTKKLTGTTGSARRGKITFRSARKGGPARDPRCCRRDSRQAQAGHARLLADPQRPEGQASGRKPASAGGSHDVTPQ